MLKHVRLKLALGFSNSKGLILKLKKNRIKLKHESLDITSKGVENREQMKQPTGN